MDPLDLTDVVSLTEQLVDIESVSLGEQRIADLVERALTGRDHLTVQRFGNTIVARTDLGRAERVILAGHLDTVPVNDNLPSRNDGEYLHGLGATDMKGGDAVIIKLAAELTEPNRDLTYVLYDAEEIAAIHNGLGKLAASHPELLEADFAILMESSRAEVEAGCQGTLRVEIRTTGERAHSARSWTGSNAIHAAAPILATLASYEPRRPVIDGLEYREGLNAVAISGGVAGNVIPDECVVTVNYRFAPDLSEEQALAHVHEVFPGYDITVTDTSPGALPGLERPAAREFLAAVGTPVSPKFGWTDVARFSALGIPAVNYGPGDASFAHKRDEKVLISRIRQCEQGLRAWLTSTEPADQQEAPR
ncbi:MAG: succinyl-diaminopimelate desuccinylase [Nocardioidaceae bacterium]|nr:succinyl-diaminopimelate desuccinylase [Nocardioidaceae bacterium]MCL2613156.1 succinyl-diaminopimelate desuccinylase [Nocardioidaceae bacterium]